ncbi:ribosome recycling factor [bacterium]|nr:ribosome recycling factor [bacterium]
MPTKPYLETAKQEFEKTKERLIHEYTKLQIGRASATLIEEIKVTAYGTDQPLKSLATISIPDSRTLQIQPWDKGILNQIEVAIQQAGLNLTPVNDGVVVRITIPPLTEERRAELSKVVYKLAEDARIGIRNARQVAHEAFKKLEADKEISEDDFHLSNKHLQEVVDKVNEEIEELAKKKEKDIMTV